MHNLCIVVNKRCYFSPSKIKISGIFVTDMEHQEYSVFPSQEEYAVITNDGDGTSQIPTGVTKGVDEIVRYEANNEPVENEEVSLGISLSELAGEEASAKFYADVGGSSDPITHNKDHNLEIETGGETFRGEVATNTGLSVVSAMAESSIVYPEDAPENPKVILPPSFRHEDLRSISLEERNSYDTEEVDSEAFVRAELEGLNEEFRDEVTDAPDRLFSQPLRVGFDVTDSDSELQAPTATRKSNRWLLDRLDREPFFLQNYQNGVQVKGPTYLTEKIEDQNGTDLTPAVRTKKDIGTDNGSRNHHSPIGPDIAAEFYLMDSDGEMFPAPSYVVVDKLLGDEELMIERTDEVLDHDDGNGRPDSSPAFQ